MEFSSAIVESKYQRFARENKGTASDSFSKLVDVNFPGDMTGKSYLDIGCNTGFFCFEAEKRGSIRSVGIDKDPGFVDLGRRIKDEMGLSKTQILCLSWDQLDEVRGTFDVVSLMSALHYRDRTMHQLMARIYDKLNCGGLFILEAGITSNRPNDILIETFVRGIDNDSGAKTYYPNEKAVMDMLDSYEEVTKIGSSQNLDEMHRFVFHARKKINTSDLTRSTLEKHPELRTMFDSVVGEREMEIGSLSFHLPWLPWRTSYDKHPIFRFFSSPSEETIGEACRYGLVAHPRDLTVEGVTSPVQDCASRFASIKRGYNPGKHGSLPVINFMTPRMEPVPNGFVIDGTNRLLALKALGIDKATVIVTKSGGS